MVRAAALLTALSHLYLTAAGFKAESTHSQHDEAHPFLTASHRSSQPQKLDLFKRQGACPSGYSSCGEISAPGVCCPNTTNCARDGAGQVACCPKNFVCTGVISGTASASGTASSVAAGTTQQSGGSTSIIVAGTVTITSTAGATGQTTPSTAAASTPVTVTAGITAGSTIPNIYYPYQYIPTTYANSAVCLAAYSYCQSESTSCFAQLAGQNGVTVSNAIGSGGTTVQGATGLSPASASSICGSLSLTACYGLRTSQCSQITNTATGGNIIAGNTARRTASPNVEVLVRAVAGIGVVAAAGLVGLI